MPVTISSSVNGAASAASEHAIKVSQQIVGHSKPYNGRLSQETPKARPSSGGAFVHVVQPVQHRARPNRTSQRSRPRIRCLQSERAMRSLLVVVADEFRQHRSKMLLVYDDYVVEALAA